MENFGLMQIGNNVGILIDFISKNPGIMKECFAHAALESIKGLNLMSQAEWHYHWFNHEADGQKYLLN